MFLNTDYGCIGTVAVPDFVIFELFGPLIELQGYVMVILAVVLGIMNQEVLAALYGLNIIWFGYLDLFTDYNYGRHAVFSAKEMLILVIYALLENFAIRQVLASGE